MENDIVIVGSSGHARVIIDIIEKQGLYNIIGLIDSFRPSGEMEMGYPILGGESLFADPHWSLTLAGCVVAIGDNWVRRKVVSNIVALHPQIRFVSVIHPSASIARNVEIGDGTVIMAGVCLNSSTNIGQHCIVNTNSTIDHDSTIGNFSSVGPGCSLGGAVKIGLCTSIGIGATIKHKVSLGSHTLIGAHSYVHSDFADHVMAFGVPAKFIKNISEGVKYL